MTMRAKHPNATNVVTCTSRITSMAKAKAGGITSAARRARRRLARPGSSGRHRAAAAAFAAMPTRVAGMRGDSILAGDGLIRPLPSQDEPGPECDDRQGGRCGSWWRRRALVEVRRSAAEAIDG